MNASRTHQARARRAATRPGFALPTVIVLLIVAGALVATLMERQSVRSLGTARELRAYQEQHAARGLQEVLNMWLRSRPSAALHELTGDRGHAFDLELADGSTARVYLGDAQASVLAATAQLDTRAGFEARRIARELEAVLAERGLSSRDPMPGVRGAAGMRVRWTRDAGPVAISAGGAVETVEAAARVALDGDARRARAFAEAITEAVRSGSREDADFNRAAADIDVGDDERNELRRLVVMQPELWGVVVEIVPRRGTRVVARYEALVAMGGSGGAGGQAARGSFVRWRRVAVQ